MNTSRKACKTRKTGRKTQSRGKDTTVSKQQQQQQQRMSGRSNRNPIVTHKRRMQFATEICREYTLEVTAIRTLLQFEHMR